MWPSWVFGFSGFQSAPPIKTTLPKGESVQHVEAGAQKLPIAGSRLRGPKIPKTQLGHIWADSILYFIPDS